MSMDNLNFENEIWRDIPEYEGLYQASNMGRIRSVDRYVNSPYNTKSFRKGKVLKPNITRNGYYQICLFKNSKVKKYSVHRLVYEVFNGQIPENMQVNHINEVKTDNRLSNLNLMTPKENINFGTGIERCHNQLINGKCSKPVLQFTLDNIFVKEYPSLMQVYRELGFKHSSIFKCCSGKYKQAYGFKWQYK